jgi:hypothetical protein
MKIYFLSCGIYQPELDVVLDEIRREGLFDCEFAVLYLQANLHVDFNRLKEGILKALDDIVADRIILLYGAKCHPEFHEFLQGRQLVRFEPSNCIEMILGERMREIDHAAKTIYLTPGWVINWQKFFDPEKLLDEAEVKQRFSSFEELLFVDTGVCEISDKQIGEISRYTGLPSKVEQVGLAVFKGNIVAAICQALQKY